MWPSGRRGTPRTRYGALLLVSCLCLVPQVWGQSILPLPTRLSVTSSQADVPRQLTLEVVEQLLQYSTTWPSLPRAWG